ncbi:YicC/YloC family endoribonuclease [Bacillus sp. FJAT-45350]|uniref:YicC/YloC family endoribonuclease n=1 Tax=Bacillus sp. FJAT-45350 TaxID=2011014 RepID=UPI00211C87AD|nr:YicC/YloC family endoribonuclease [Bacillus sp. FJAT-45350]
MMITSMTGYGQAKLEQGNYVVTVEIRSFNHRFSEISVRIPRSFLHLEDQIKKTIQTFVHRGKVDVYISIEGEGLVKRMLDVDWELLKQYIKTANEMQNITGATLNMPSVDTLLLHEQIVSVREEEATDEAINGLVLETTKLATEKLFDMRRLEGHALYKDFKVRIDKMTETTKQLSLYAPTVSENYQKRLEKRMTDYLKGKLDVDESRILTEVAIFAEKASIDEEITRLLSHLNQFLSIINEGGVIGRKLDFLVQEMNRETNTIGSKANDIHISKQVVDLKSEIEKIKEQVQNIE